MKTYVDPDNSSFLTALTGLAALALAACSTPTVVIRPDGTVVASRPSLGGAGAMDLAHGPTRLRFSDDNQTSFRDAAQAWRTATAAKAMGSMVQGVADSSAVAAVVE